MGDQTAPTNLPDYLRRLAAEVESRGMAMDAACMLTLHGNEIAVVTFGKEPGAGMDLLADVARQKFAAQQAVRSKLFLPPGVQ